MRRSRRGGGANEVEEEEKQIRRSSRKGRGANKEEEQEMRRRSRTVVELSVQPRAPAPPSPPAATAHKKSAIHPDMFNLLLPLPSNTDLTFNPSSSYLLNFLILQSSFHPRIS